MASANGRGSGDAVEYCLSLRVWDVLLWFAIIGRPMRDITVLTEFSKTMALCTMQILPRYPPSPIFL